MNLPQQDAQGQDESILKLPATQAGQAGQAGHAGHAGRLPAVLLFGMPGVGKGTQGSLLGTMNGMFHVSTGEIFRGLDLNSEDGKLVASYIDRGELVPDEVTIEVWQHWMSDQIAAQKFDPAADVLLLDGIPRRVRQCEILEDHIDVLAVVHLAAPTDEPIIERLRSRALIEGRADDADERIIRRRFQIYRETTQPVLGYYPPSIVHTVDPLGTQMEIKKRILECVIPVIRQYERAG